MEERIEKELGRCDFESQEELRRYVGSVQALIREYEQQLYAEDCYNAVEREKIRGWRSRVHRMQREKSDVAVKTENVDELERTARIVHRQVGKADTNQRVLEKSTLKLMGLNYTSKDIEKALAAAKEKMIEGRKKEKRERNMVLIAFGVFLLVCILILLDKFFLKR